MNFRTFGDVDKLDLKTDPTTGGSLGICSITYRDSKNAITLGHHAAKRAVQNGNQLKIGMQSIRVVLDRDGLKCAKITTVVLEAKRRKEAEARRKEEEARKKEKEAAARNRPPPIGPRAAVAPLSKPPTLQPIRRDRSPVRDHDNRFSKPRPPNYRAIDELGRRPAVFISSKFIPGEMRFCRHLYGRLRNFGVQEILWDSNGFFVVFETARGLYNCFRMCDGDRLFSYRMGMQLFPRGNPNTKPEPPQLRSQSPQTEPMKKSLGRVNVISEAIDDLVQELKDALSSDVRKRVADRQLYDWLAPERLEKLRKSDDQPKTIDTNVASTPLSDITSSVPPLTSIFARSVPKQPSILTSASISALPRFKKHKPKKRQETPTSDASPMLNGKAGNEEARPLAHRLNYYHLDGSDDESTTTDHRPISRGSASRALSTDIGDDDSFGLATSLSNRKRKRSMGGRTPSRLKDAAFSTDDEDGHSKTTENATDGGIRVDISTHPDMENTHAESDEEGQDVPRKRPRQINSSMGEGGQGKTPDKSNQSGAHCGVADENDEVDIVGLEDGQSAVDKNEWLNKISLAQPVYKFPSEGKEECESVDDATEAPQVVDYSWTVSTTGYPHATVDDDDEMIMDLDGLQYLVKDDEDVNFLRAAVRGVEPENVGNVYAWTCKMKEVRAANREGKWGPVHSLVKIEGFYRPNISGCARTEGYRKIPEAEKSMYLPHRLAVAAKRANAPIQLSPTTTRTTTTSTKVVSSSRSNRVNNRRLVQELNNQKQILCGESDVMRFNQLKKRKKPVRFARSAIHNWGLYAMENISANDMIIEYVGEIIRQQVADIRERKYIKSGIGSSYLFRIDENTVIDATKKGGIARFINHSCTPNCTAKIIKVEGSKRIVIYAMRDIKENEELTYDYKFERELDSDERIPCLCGSSGCKGFLN